MAIWVDIFYLSVIIMTLYLLDPDLRKQRIRMSHSNASSRTLVSMSWEHEVIFQTLFIAGFEPETFTSQTFKSEPITTGATTLVVGYNVTSQFITLINTVTVKEWPWIFVVLIAILVYACTGLNYNVYHMLRVWFSQKTSYQFLVKVNQKPHFHCLPRIRADLT